MPVKVPEPFAIILRKEAANALSLTTDTILATVEQSAFSDEDGDLLVLGPLWPEAADEFIGRLKGLGLVYVDDFFEIGLDKPDWLQILCVEKNAS